MKLEQFAVFAKALSDNSRVRALLALKQGELCVCQIIALLRLAPSTVSKHMAVLKQAGLVESRKQGRWIYFRLAKDPQSCAQKLLGLAIEILEREETITNDKRELKKIVCCDMGDLCKVLRKS